MILSKVIKPVVALSYCRQSHKPVVAFRGRPVNMRASAYPRKEITDESLQTRSDLVVQVRVRGTDDPRNHQAHQHAVGGGSGVAAEDRAARRLPRHQAAEQ